MDHWMDHFEAAKKVPIHTVTLDDDFFVEIRILSRRDKVFKDLTCT